MFVNPFLMPTKSVAKKNMNENYKKMPRNTPFGNSRRRRTLAFLSPSTFFLVSLLVVAAGPTPLLALTSLTNAATTTTRRSLGLLSFDLDDTLFSTTTVVQAGNDAMIRHMAERYQCQTDIPQFLATTRSIRQALTTTTTPMTYTELRKRTIRAEMERITAESAPNHVVEECFDVWLDERNAAAGLNLFPHAVQSLQEIVQAFPDACIAAITNGRGNPLHIDPLRPYFEFCVSGEDEGVFPSRKPHKGIYQQALRVYRERYPDHDQDSHVWIHVGDCLANDVGASAACGAAACWLAPNEENEQAAASRIVSGKQPSWSTASTQDLQERSKLAQEAQEHVTVRIQSLADLPAAIEKVLQSSFVNNLRR